MANKIKWTRNGNSIRTQFSDDEQYLISGILHFLTLYVLEARTENGRFYKPIAEAHYMKEMKRIAEIHKRGGDISPWSKRKFYLNIKPLYKEHPQNGNIWTYKEEVK